MIRSLSLVAGQVSNSGTKKYDLILDGSNLPIGIQRGTGGVIKIRNRVANEDDVKVKSLAGPTKYAHVDYLTCLKEVRLG